MRKLLPIVKSLGNNEKFKAQISVMTYNILAQSLVVREYFPYCKDQTLKWNYRKKKLIEEIKEYSPDIACFQEMDQTDFWFQELTSLGYEGIHKRRPAKKHDGSSIFFKKAKFELLEKKELEYNGLAGHYLNFQTHNVGVLVALKMLNVDNANTQGLLVCNHHLYWKVGYNAWRLMQMNHMASAAKQLNEKYQYPIIFCGDYNDTPTEPLYSCMTGHPLLNLHSKNLSLPEDCLIADPTLFSAPVEAGRLPTDIEKEDFKQNIMKIASGFKDLFSAPCYSAYHHYRSIEAAAEGLNLETQQNQDQDQNQDSEGKKLEKLAREEPEFTTFAMWTGCIDFLFVNDPERKLTLTEILQLPKREQLQLEQALPNTQYPSDHLCLMARFGIN